MKRLTVLLIAILLIAVMGSAAYATDYAAMLMDPDVKEVVIKDEYHLTQSLEIPEGKTVIIAEEGNLVINGSEKTDDGMFLCLSFLKDSVFEVYGKVTTTYNFYPNFVIADVSIKEGAKAIIHESAKTDDFANIHLYKGGEIELAEDVIPEGYELAWRQEEGGLKILNEMLSAPYINRVTVSCDITVKDGEKLTVPAGQFLDIEGSVTVLPGGELDISPESNSFFGYQTVKEGDVTKLLPPEEQ